MINHRNIYLSTIINKKTIKYIIAFTYHFLKVLIFQKVNGYIKNHDGFRYLKLIPSKKEDMNVITL